MTQPLPRLADVCEQTIENAHDLVRLAPARPLLPSPSSFAGTLEQLWRQHVEPNTPTAAAVGQFHRMLTDYVRDPNALLLIRQGRGMERRAVYATSEGTRLKGTDNAPAWWVQYALQQGYVIAPGSFTRVVENLPAHFFDVARAMPSSANAAGWHIAHIFAVKDRNIDYRAWRRRDAIARFVRNVHPCNYFLVPKQDWQKWGGDARVIAFAAERYRMRYAEVWGEFVELAGADDAALGTVTGDFRYEYDAVVAAVPRVRNAGTKEPNPTGVSRGRVRASYPARRLLFKREVIERLDAGDVFQVVTPEAMFEMTRADFDRVFANVRASASYRQGGIYHYSTIPAKALPFVVRAQK